MVDYCSENPDTCASHTLTVPPLNKSYGERSWTKTGCHVHWIEWSGSRRNPEATPFKQENCTVEYNGRSNYLVTLPNGHKIVRRDGDYGFKVIGGTLV